MDKQTFMIEIEKTIFDSERGVDMNLNTTSYAPTLREANKIAKEEVSKGNKVEIWKLIRRY